MTSQFFYLPAEPKKTEEERIKFTQGRMKMVKDFLQEKIVNKFLENDFSPKIFVDELANQVPNPVVSIKIITDKDCNVSKRYNIKSNYFSKVMDDFCMTNRCKIDKTDFLYMLMLTFRDNGISVSPALGTLNIELS